MGEKKADTRNNGNATAATRAKNKYRDKNYDRITTATDKCQTMEEVREMNREIRKHSAGIKMEEEETKE